MRYRYDHRIAILGLVVGVIILAGGLLTGNRTTAGAIAMAVIVTSTMAAYVRVPNRPGDTDERAGGRR